MYLEMCIYIFKCVHVYYIYRYVYIYRFNIIYDLNGYLRFKHLVHAGGMTNPPKKENDSPFPRQQPTTNNWEIRL